MKFTDKKVIRLPKRDIRPEMLRGMTLRERIESKSRVLGFKSADGDMQLYAYPTKVTPAVFSSNGDTASIDLPHSQKVVYIGDPCYTMASRHYYFYLEVMCNQINARGLFDFDLIDEQMPNHKFRFTICMALDDGTYKSIGKGGSVFDVDSGQLAVMSCQYIYHFGRQDMGLFSSYTDGDTHYPMQYNLWGEGNGGGRLDLKRLNSLGFFGEQGRSQKGFNVYLNDKHVVFGSHRIRHYMC
jgi:hypothetical protein